MIHGVTRLALLALALAGCAPAPATLVVSVRTDLVPGVELAAVETVVIDGFALEVLRNRVPALAADDYLAGVEVARDSDLTPGPYDVRVTLLDSSDTTVLERRVRVDVATTRDELITLTRTCAGVTCPGAGEDVALSECLAGRCVTVGCNDEHPERCADTECAEDADCPAMGSACVQASCVEGSCLYAPDDTICAGARCDFIDGCG